MKGSSEVTLYMMQLDLVQRIIKERELTIESYFSRIEESLLETIPNNNNNHEQYQALINTGSD